MAIQVTYRRTSRLSMRIVKNGDVHVSVPIGMPREPSIIYYKPTISRWGQCNIKDRSICISAYVLLLPEWCVEHVVVHELCHLLEPSHNARFHALMDKYFPSWREARKETHKICRMEENKEE